MVASCAIFAVLLLALAADGKEQDPCSDEFIDLINSKQNSWKAGRNFPVNTPLSFIKNRLGAIKGKNFAKIPILNEHDAELIASLPESFDPRDKWPNCPSLNEIRDQGSCGSCWAFGAVDAMTDRYCIHSNGQNFHFSAEDVLSCSGCGDCKGGDSLCVWLYWNDTGIVSGGNYNSSQGCRPYTIDVCDHYNNRDGKLLPCEELIADTPECVKSCESGYNVNYDKDLRRAKTYYTDFDDEDEIKDELFQNGPVEAVFDVYGDFPCYKEGVYQHVEGDFLGRHAVKMMGWGVENGEKYWLMANSWNSEWGEKGFFKILRGDDHCSIEDEILAGLPLIY